MCWNSLKRTRVKIYKTEERPSPSDWISKEAISFEIGDLVIENLPFSELWFADVTDTNSMDPTIDIGHTAILGKLTDHDDLQVGDVCAYAVPGKYIMHRIYEIGEDDEGRWYKFKGDNNYSVDRYIVRDAHVQWVLIGILY